MKELWIVGKFVKPSPMGSVWDFQGIFDSENKAIKACISKDYFYASVELNKTIPDESVEWDVIYPQLTTNKSTDNIKSMGEL